MVRSNPRPASARTLRSARPGPGASRTSRPAHHRPASGRRRASPSPSPVETACRRMTVCCLMGAVRHRRAGPSAAAGRLGPGAPITDPAVLSRESWAIWSCQRHPRPLRGTVAAAATGVVNGGFRRPRSASPVSSRPSPSVRVGPREIKYARYPFALDNHLSRVHDGVNASDDAAGRAFLGGRLGEVRFAAMVQRIGRCRWPCRSLMARRPSTGRCWPDMVHLHQRARAADGG